jgi:HK97 family phage prohead protease
MKTTKQSLGLYQSMDIKMIGEDEQDSIVFISGYASVYRTPEGAIQVDRDDETVNTDNIDVTSYEKNPILIFNHDFSRPIGRITKITKDYKGLYVEAEVHRLHGEEAAYEAVKKGLLKSFSIGFVPKEYDILAGDIVQITSAELVEISLAPVQSNPEALFRVIGTKSLGISVAEMAKQNNITADELKGICSKNTKGNNLNIEQKTAEITPAQDPVATPVVEPKVEPKVELTPTPVVPVTPVTVPTVEPKADTSKDNVSINLETLVNAMVEADLKAEAAKEAAKQEVIKKEQDEVNAKLQAQELRVQTAIEYIKERTEAIKNTPAGDIDIEELDSFYELLSTTVETIDGKVKEVVESIKAQSTEA